MRHKKAAAGVATALRANAGSLRRNPDMPEHQRRAILASEVRRICLNGPHQRKGVVRS